MFWCLIVTELSFWSSSWNVEKLSLYLIRRHLLLYILVCNSSWKKYSTFNDWNIDYGPKMLGEIFKVKAMDYNLHIKNILERNHTIRLFQWHKKHCFVYKNCCHFGRIPMWKLNGERHKIQSITQSNSTNLWNLLFVFYVMFLKLIFASEHVKSLLFKRKISLCKNLHLVPAFESYHGSIFCKQIAAWQWSVLTYGIDQSQH